MTEPLNPAWIEAHNARCGATWRPVLAAIAQLGLEDSREIVRLAREDGLAMNEVARRIRARLGCAWPAHLDARVGMEAFGHALEALGLYDDDFRPDAERLAALRKADELERLATPRGADG